MEKPTSSLCITERFPSLEMSSGSDDGILCDDLADDDSPFEDETLDFRPGSHQHHVNSLERLRHHEGNSSDERESSSAAETCLLKPHSTSVSASGEYFDFSSPRNAIMPPSTSIRQRQRQSNHVLLHIYDLIATDTLMLLPWGCVCEIGKCFNEVNSALHELGTGAYHVGVECNGIEYAYGACSQPYKSGVFSCIPKLSPGYQYRTSIDFGEIQLVRSSWVSTSIDQDDEAAATNGSGTNDLNSPKSVTSTNFKQVTQFVDGRSIMKEMACEYMGVDYDILRRNCCTFAADACVRLGVPVEQIPSWFRNLAETGAYSQDMAQAAILQPLQKVLSTAAADATMCGADETLESDNKAIAMSTNSALTAAAGTGAAARVMYNDDEETGFELIAKRNAANTRDVVVVIDADPNPHYNLRRQQHQQEQQRAFRPLGPASLAY